MIILTKRIVSLILVLCLVISASCITSSALYEIDDDTSVVPLMLNTGVSVAAVEPSDLDYYLEFNGASVAKFLAYILYSLTGSTTSMSSSVYTFLDSIDDQLLDQYSLLGSMSSYMSNISSNSNLIRISLDAIEDDVSIFESRFNSVISWLTSVDSSVGAVNTSVGIVNSTLLDQLNVSAGVKVLGATGDQETLSGAWSFETLVRAGFRGLRNYLNTQLALPAGYVTLDHNGKNFTLDKPWTLSDVLSIAFRGISANIKGSESDNIYTSTLNDNNNTTTTVNSTGLGPLLNTQLSNIGENLGHLAFMFASDDDIKLKQDSQPVLDEADSFYDDSSDSNIKVSAGNVGSLKGIANNFSGVLDTGANIDDAFSIVSNSNSFRWFSSETFQSIDSVGVASASDPYSVYEQLHDDFNSVYFPDRE